MRVIEREQEHCSLVLVELVYSNKKMLNIKGEKLFYTNIIQRLRGTAEESVLLNHFVMTLW